MRKAIGLVCACVLVFLGGSVAEYKTNYVSDYHRNYSWAAEALAGLRNEKMTELCGVKVSLFEGSSKATHLPYFAFGTSGAEVARLKRQCKKKEALTFLAHLRKPDDLLCEFDVMFLRNSINLHKFTLRELGTDNEELKRLETLCKARRQLPPSSRWRRDSI